MDVTNLKAMISTLEQLIDLKAPFDMTIYLNTSYRNPHRSLKEEVEAGTVACACGWYRLEHKFHHGSLSRHFDIPQNTFRHLFSCTSTLYNKPVKEVTARDTIDQINNLLEGKYEHS